jgi:UDP-glucose 4-epimerase
MDDAVVLVTGSSGRLGGALCARFPEAIGLDVRPGGRTTHSDLDAAFAELERRCEGGREAIVFHAGALHKPNLATHSLEEFVELNIAFTAKMLRLLATSTVVKLRKLVFTSTTSVFGGGYGSGTVWVDEKSTPVIKNVYGWSKRAAEQLIELQKRPQFVILRACRFFPEEDDRDTPHDDLEEQNLKFVHLLNGRRLLLQDVVSAHVCAATIGASESFCVNLGNTVAVARHEGMSVTAEVLLESYPFLAQVLKRKHWKLP